MFTRTLLLSVTLIAASSSAFAGMAAERWHNSEARQNFLAAKAIQFNIDISTEEGKAELEAALEANRIEVAAELGFDITTEEGKAAFREYRREKVTEHATELGYDLTTREGRQDFREYRKEMRQLRRSQIASLTAEQREELRAEMEGLNREERRELLAEMFSE